MWFVNSLKWKQVKKETKVDTFKIKAIELRQSF